MFVGKKNWKNYHFSPRHTKLRISQDIRRVRTTIIESAMTIFRHCHNVLNNNIIYCTVVMKKKLNSAF